MILRCDLQKQYLAYKKAIDDAVLEVMSSGSYILGPTTTRFEKEFNQYLGTQYGMGVANGTDALLLSLKALGIGPGDDVITTPFSAIPTSSAIIATGATPVFVDINPETFLIDFKKIEERLSKKTKAVLGVHIFGNVFDVAKLEKIVGPNIPVLEDACQAHGSEIDGKKAGSLGLLNSFSFYPTKNLGGLGDGGFITMRTKELYEKVKLLRQYGMETRDKIVINGINSRLDDLQSAILSVKLKHLDNMNSRREEIAKRYCQQLNPKYIRFQKVSHNIKTNNHVLSIIVENQRDQLLEHLEKKAIQCHVFYRQPIATQPANQYLGYKTGDLPNTEFVCNNILAIPIYPEMEMNQVDQVIESINGFWS